MTTTDTTTETVEADYARPVPPAWTARIGFGQPVFGQVMDFLTDEARLLDDSRLEEWLTYLADDISYTMPVRRSVLRGGESIDPRMLHFEDDFDSLKLRVWRVTRSDSAYAENPPSRVRHYITNVEVHETANPDELAVRSYELVLRSRWDRAEYDIVSCHRDDVLRRNHTTDGPPFKIAQRIIITDQVTIGTPNLAIML